MNGAILGILLASVSTFAVAAEMPKPVSKDGLVCTQVYSENEVTIIHMERGREMTVQLAPSEEILKVSVSDSAHLMSSVLDNKNIYLLKPISALPPQPLTVITRRADGSIRTYLAEVDARIPDDRPASTLLAEAAMRAGALTPPDPLKPCYVVRYTYPADERAKAIADWRAHHAQQSALERAAHDAALLRQHAVEKANFHYVGIGDRNLAPDRMFDDGNSTFLEFWGNRPVPAVYGIDRAGHDKLLTGFSVEDGLCPGSTAVSGACVKLHVVAPEFRLRDQEDLAGNASSVLIFNRAFNPVGNRPGTGTTSPFVQREVGK